MHCLALLEDEDLLRKSLCQKNKPDIIEDDIPTATQPLSPPCKTLYYRVVVFTVTSF